MHNSPETLPHLSEALLYPRRRDQARRPRHPDKHTIRSSITNHGQPKGHAPGGPEYVPSRHSLRAANATPCTTVHVREVGED